MAAEPVDVARRALEAFGRGGIEDPEELLGHLHEDVVWLTAERSVEDAEYTGHDGVRRYFATVRDAFTEFRIVPEEFIDLGDGTIVAFVNASGRGRGSGFPFERPGIAHVFTVRGDKIARFRWFEDRQEALDWARAVG